MRFIVYLLLIGGCLPAAADDCSLSAKTCFGVNWAVATARDVRGVEVASKRRSGATPLHWAAAYGQEAAVAALLENGADVRATAGWQGETPLHRAIRENNTFEVVALLLRHGADVNARTNFGSTPLHLAVKHRRGVEMMSHLLAGGAAVNAANREGMTPLDVALVSDDTVAASAAELLREHGATAGYDLAGECRSSAGECFAVNWKSAQAAQLGDVEVNARGEDGSTPLHWAARYSESVDVISTLVAMGADVNAEDENGRVPLHRVLEGGVNAQVVDALLRHGADSNASSKNCSAEVTLCLYSPLQMAVQEDSLAAVSMLLQHGANVDAREQDGFTPLMMAVTLSRSIDIIKTLMDNRATLMFQVKHEQTTYDADEYFRRQIEMPILHWAAGYHENIAVISLVLATTGVDVNIVGHNKRTPLHWAAAHNKNPDVISFLLERGANVNALEFEDKTLLHLAAEYNQNPEVISLLLEKGADINALAGKGETPLHLAAEYNQNPEVISLLLEKGADINALAGKGETPLHLAARYNQNPEVISLLLEKGADIHALSRDGRIPLQLSKYNKNPEVKLLLLRISEDNTAPAEVE